MNIEENNKKMAKEDIQNIPLVMKTEIQRLLMKCLFPSQVRNLGQTAEGDRERVPMWKSVELGHGVPGRSPHGIRRVRGSLRAWSFSKDCQWMAGEQNENYYL